MSRQFIVVPESLEADASGRATERPSFAFRQVLEAVDQLAAPDDRIYLAPANSFGGTLTEEQAAFRYLTGKGPRSYQLLCPGENLGGYQRPAEYIDTWGNAVELRRLIRIEGARFELVVAEPHARRAEWCFRRAGFSLDRVHAVPIRRERQPVVRRTFYYRSAFLHRLYEVVAYRRDRWKYRRERPIKRV